MNLEADWDDSVPAFQCFFQLPSPTDSVVPMSCPGGAASPCGGTCCPTEGFICNTQIPGLAYCDPSDDPNIAADVTAVTQLGFGAQKFNTSAGALPTNLGTNRLYTPTTSVMNGTTISYSQRSQISHSVVNIGTGTVRSAGAATAIGGAFTSVSTEGRRWGREKSTQV